MNDSCSQEMVTGKTRHPDILAIWVEGKLRLQHRGCSGIITNCGGGVYLCKTEQGGCGSIFQHEEIFPLPGADPSTPLGAGGEGR